MTENVDDADDPLAAEEQRLRQQRHWTIPNALCLLRLIGSAIVVALAILQQANAVAILFLVLAATDWLDGKLAVWLDQRSDFGARLDSVADASMYGTLLFAVFWTRTDQILAEWIWIAAGLAAYVASCAASLIKFQAWPSYHTRSAKTAWLLMVIAVISLFLEWSVWPLRIAMTGVAIANLESLAITLLLRERRVEVPSVFRARHVVSGQSPAEP